MKFESFGGRFEIPASPYRAACWLDLRRQFASLSGAERADGAARLGGESGLGGVVADEEMSAPRSGREVANRHWV